MHEKIRDVLTTQSERDLLSLVTTVVVSICLTISVQRVDTTEVVKSSSRQKKRSPKRLAEGEIAVDLMGGELPPLEVYEALCELAKVRSERFFAVGEARLVTQLQKRSSLPNVLLHPAQEFIGMEESPLYAVRRKKNSSMSVGMRLLKEGKVSVFLSTGNTGALMATAILDLGLLPGVERPALLVLIPSRNGKVAVLDVGANLSIDPNHLLQFARLGSAYMQHIEGKNSPRIGLLNIGVEEQKGTLHHKQAYHALIDHFPTQFRGNVEGGDVFRGEVDVLVTDGFSGNVFLKTCEGVTSFLIDSVKEEFASPEGEKIAKDLETRYDYSQYPGALLAGVQGFVMKCHGYSSKRAVQNGIQGALELRKNCWKSVFSSFLKPGADH